MSHTATFTCLAALIVFGSTGILASVAAVQAWHRPGRLGRLYSRVMLVVLSAVGVVGAVMACSAFRQLNFSQRATQALSDAHDSQTDQRQRLHEQVVQAKAVQARLTANLHQAQSQVEPLQAEVQVIAKLKEENLIVSREQAEWMERHFQYDIYMEGLWLQVKALQLELEQKQATLEELRMPKARATHR